MTADHWVKHVSGRKGGTDSKELHVVDKNRTGKSVCRGMRDMRLALARTAKTSIQTKIAYIGIYTHPHMMIVKNSPPGTCGRPEAV